MYHDYNYNCKRENKRWMRDSSNSGEGQLCLSYIHQTK